MRARIMKRTIDALHAPEVGEVVLWDDALAGFGVRVRPSGAKTYVLMYRAGTGRAATQGDDRHTRFSLEPRHRAC
jgi:hypothetical protein